MLNFTIDILKESEITALLDLQKANLVQNLDAQTIDSQGFVSFVYTPEIIKAMMQEEPQIIAKDGDLIIGYALTTTLKYGETMTLMKPLVEMSQNLSYNDQPLSQSWYYIMGQVCVRAGYRGKGVFEALYQGHKQYLSSEYDFVITEIADNNKRSLAAHRRIGFKTIHEYYDDISKKNWHVVLWDFK
jgi:GNAT superfamily N-acetyltransferase